MSQTLQYVFPSPFFSLARENMEIWNVFKTLIAAECSGIEVKLIRNFETVVSNETPEFLKMNPIGMLVMFSKNYFFLCLEPSYCYSFLKTDNLLLGPSPIEYAEEAAIVAPKRALGALNTHLASNTDLVGHLVTLADSVLTFDTQPLPWIHSAYD
ncbi:hypothetical protein SLEP1_g34078 [Rubroshorea leprosula]|uniref:Uncharacterized protein n=1 Tax=Rubroshorea leprosula TaxID=152421 RepID=A0AAV5KIM3_9ROSI|nr:hypothetical protein SLEP1_g34078 [Rubroshorea leprosula]